MPHAPNENMRSFAEETLPEDESSPIKKTQERKEAIKGRIKNMESEMNNANQRIVRTIEDIANTMQNSDTKTAKEGLAQVMELLQKNESARSFASKDHINSLIKIGKANKLNRDADVQRMVDELRTIVIGLQAAFEREYIGLRGYESVAAMFNDHIIDVATRMKSLQKILVTNVRFDHEAKTIYVQCNKSLDPKTEIDLQEQIELAIPEYIKADFINQKLQSYAVKIERNAK